MGRRGEQLRWLAAIDLRPTAPPPPAGYTRRHSCAFCGKLGLAHESTRPAAKLYCNKGCLMLFKKYHMGDTLAKVA